MNRNRLCILALGAVLAGGAGYALDANTGTFSIVAVDSLTGELGVAVQSRAFAVGPSVAWAEAGVGAVATQAQTNQAFGPRGLEMMRRGLTAGETLDALLEDDPGRENRQVGIVDAGGGTGAFTGSLCLDWAGGRTGPGYACQGNILASDEVVADMVRAFESGEGELADRLLAALVAGQAAGGDKRGMQSAALLVVRPSEEFPQYRYRYVDLRVEDHPDPINELIRLYEIHKRSELLEAHARYARIYEEAGRTGLAEREEGLVGRMLEEALAEDGEEAEYLNNLAWFAATNDLFLERALLAAERAAALAPGEAYILDTLAEAQYRAGLVEEAIATIRKAIELDPESDYYRQQLERFRE
jgi:uncharacterized Ntn-hydrolase superfamily protein